MDHQIQSRTEFLKVSKFQSIKTKILIFALLATIIPSLVLGWLSYLHSSKLLRQKISHELSNAISQASSELDLWMKERIYDLRVFSSSYIISENLAAKQGKPRSGVNDPAAREHIKAYLNSVEEKFNDYEELILINPAGELAITGSDTPSSEPFPAAWLDQLQMNPPKWGKHHFTPYIGRKSIFLAEAVRAPNGDPLGVLAAKVNIEAIRSILKCHTSDDINALRETNAELHQISITDGLTGLYNRRTHP